MVLEVLLDTSFILPSFGVEVDRDVLDALRILSRNRSKVNVYYSSYNLLEALFVLLREIRKGNLALYDAIEMVREGVFNVVNSLKRLEENPDAFSGALKMYNMGHQDMFDNILYLHALENGVHFLTIDEELRLFIKEKKLQDITIMPQELAQSLENIRRQDI